MRISSTMMVGNYLNQLNKSYESQTNLLKQSDGSKLHRPSDNAVDYSKYLRYQNSSTENTQYQSNASTAVSWMKTSDSAMVNIENIMQTIVEKSNAAANGGTNNSSDMETIGKEMLAEIQEMVSAGNTQLGDQYVFSGQSDLVQPFTLSSSTVSRGEAKTLNDTQKSFFNDTDSTGTTGISQMLTLTGSDGNTYYANTVTGKVYTQKFVESGYKDKVAAGQTTAADADAAADLGGSISISANFKNTGEIISGTTGVGTDWSKSVTTTSGTSVTLKFSTVSQQIVTYNGDDKYISMTKRNGAQDQASDTVNVTGQDLFGSDIFDDANSGNSLSGTATLNDLLMLQTKTTSGDSSWVSTDGITLANNADSVMTKAETKLAARQKVYEDVQTMLTTQSESITSDITNVSATDVAALSVQYMEAQTVYNMSLAMGSKVLPQSLADYLS